MLDKSKYGFIYCSTNLITSMIYIGKRVIKNNKADEIYLGSGTYLRNSILKNGKEMFKRKILCYCDDEEELKQKENEYLKNLADKCLYPNGYNISVQSGGGDLTSHHPNKEKIYTKQKISREKYFQCILDEENQGFKRPKHVRENISKGLTGLKKTEEHNLNNSKSHKNPEVVKKIMESRKRNNVEWNTKETREKMSAIATGRPKPEGWGQKHSEKLKGKPQPESEIERMKKFMTDPKNKILCEKCKLLLNKCNYNQHFKKCKL